MECKICGRLFREQNYYFEWNSEKIQTEPGFFYISSICPACHARRIKEYLDKNRGVLQKFIWIKKGRMNIDWKIFLETHEDYGWNTMDFLCAIGILTHDGYRLSLRGRIESFVGKRGHYSFKRKEDALSFSNWLRRESGGRMNYGVCYISSICV
ncbi:MAG: hypothetical protein WC157_02755 [Candidatus Paceibacterota bacterium]